MGDKKSAKGRLDKYYYMAKEQGYRSRAAFKLIQLNQKFGFLENSRVVLDLCAAPGGWMQVASKYTPMSSIIIGVDLDPIKAIPNCVGLQEDITTEKCRTAIKREIKHFKADCVLHDGAPNVGRAWIQDAFDQAELTLKSLKLACDFLVQGGTFVTKVFRSRDYFALMWVLNKLFDKVHATKPSASRNVSAEIFVVCLGYKAPSNLDPRLLDPKYIFDEVDSGPKVNIFAKKANKKAPALGYKTGQSTTHESITVSQFLQSEDAIQTLSECTEIVFDKEADGVYKDDKLTTDEIKECLKDIKVLGKKELRQLLNWRKKLLPTFQELNNIVEDEDKDGESDVETQDIDMTPEEREQLDLQKKIEQVTKNEKKKLKAKKKKEERAKQKLRERALHEMGLPSNNIEQEDAELFSVLNLKNKQHMKDVLENKNGIDDEADEALEFESENDSEEAETNYRIQREKELEDMYSNHKSLQTVQGRAQAKLDRLRKNDNASAAVSSSKGNNGNKQSAIAADEKNSENPLLVEFKHKLSNKEKTEQWFEQDEFNLLSDQEDEEDEDIEIERKLNKYKKNAVNTFDDADSDEDSDVPEYVATARLAKQKKNNKRSKVSSAFEGGFETVPVKSLSDSELEQEESEDTDDDDIHRVNLTPKELAIGQAMKVDNKRHDLEDDSYNRYSFQDGDLPDWFAEDEKKHSQKPQEIPKDVVEFYKQRMRELDARPIKKVAEAKARKKMKALRKLDQMKKKAESIVNNADMNEQSKSRALQQMYKKAKAKKPKEMAYVVASKSGAQRKPSRPNGVTGAYKMVDPRMKTDKRAMARAERNKKKSSKKRKNGGGR